MIELLLLLTLITFGCRYIFLEPKLPIRLGYKAKHFLSYSAPAVLAAIASPILFMPAGELALHLHNPYIWAAVVAILIMLSTQQMLLTVSLSFIVFIALGQYL
ncbi:AzlD domain-containing protein [Dasania sp. GY-MA-18]|uniref:AzlD domain-containing protein n=1 Tax=Dasania phycosphaerae TaxID=2950436 RepID=A0A9J6RNH6_9GAMM|nr:MULTISPECIES: AzlD domain-containing protein [Dasania]MCR8923465.1 AzlD domain-containing protein [Dasania sp. GY-MA-18]MCZ0865898.1 AzlD domain-containing protein [Dasania phycosphaerae]MCZ0869622.1 AzlD domain-containing protein [Dasania phycosphaerae]